MRCREDRDELCREELELVARVDSNGCEGAVSSRLDSVASGAPPLGLRLRGARVSAMDTLKGAMIRFYPGT